MTHEKAMFLLAWLIILGYLYASPNDNQLEDSHSGLTFFEENWDEALKKAKTENKLIFLDIYASWCGSCKRLKETTFNDREAGDLYNANFISLALDGEKGEVKILADNYGIRAYPVLLFVDHTGRLVAEVIGYHNPHRFVQLGKRVLNQQ